MALISLLICEDCPYAQTGSCLPGLQIRVCIGKLFSFFSSKTYVVGTQKNRLNETVLLSTPKLMLKIMGKKIFAVLC